VARGAGADVVVVGESGGPATRHHERCLGEVAAGDGNAGEQRRNLVHGREVHALDAEFAGVRVEVEATVGALDEFEKLRLVRRIDDGRAGLAVFAGGGIDDDEVRAHDFHEGGEGAVVAGKRVEVLVDVVHRAKAGEGAGGGST